MNGGSCTCSATMRDGHLMVYDTSRCPIHSSAGSRVTGVDTDLATLREAIDDALLVFVDTMWERAYQNTAPAALARVEAELARLREERDALDDSLRDAGQIATMMRDRAEAAETRVEHLTEACIREADRVLAAEARCARLLFIAENLFQMVPQSVWRDHGGDDMQGHYEGDYHAERLREELAGYREALAGPDTPADSQEDKT